MHCVALLSSQEQTRSGGRARHLLQHAAEILRDARVGGHHHAEPIVLLLVEAVRWVHAALVQYAARRQLWPSQVTSILMSRTATRPALPTWLGPRTPC